MKTGLLVSVRTASEARLAQVWGADLIDVKEPSRGSLGRPQDVVVRSILNEIAGKLPVSAAQGELREDETILWDWEELSFVKWGLSGCVDRDWKSMLRKRSERLGSRVVLVAYADAVLAKSPSPEEVLAFACSKPWSDPVFLIDTFDKSLDVNLRRKTMLDWIALDTLASWSTRCRAAGVRLALAGSLGIEEIEKLLPVRPDWIGVRGAVCEGQDREAAFSVNKLHQLVELLSSSSSLAG